MVRTWWTDGAGGANPQRADETVKAEAPAGHGVPPNMKDKPADLDWNRYLGRARWRAWDPPQYYNFRNYRDFSGGILADKFVHWVDVVHMFMDEDGLISADNTGGLFVAKDGRDVQDTISLHLEYPGRWVALIPTWRRPDCRARESNSCGSRGHFRIDRTKFEYFPELANAKPLTVECKTDLVAEHVEDFLNSCRSRTIPKGDVALEHRPRKPPTWAISPMRRGAGFTSIPIAKIVLPA